MGDLSDWTPRQLYERGLITQQELDQREGATDVFFIVGPKQNDEGVYVPKDELLEVFNDRAKAESWLGGQLMGAVMGSMLQIKPGGTLSMLVTRGTSDESIQMSGGWALRNPNAERESVEFRVEHYRAVKR